MAPATTQPSVLLLGLVLAASACTGPPVIGDPLPGSVHLVSNPPLAPYAVTLRVDEAGEPGGRIATFDAGDEIVVTWSTLPLPTDKWIEINGQDCEGTFEIRERFQTDVLLVLLPDGSCRIEARGMQPETGLGSQPPG